MNGNTVNYLFPIVPSSYGSTYNYNVEQSMWLPLYNNFTYGKTPGIDYSLSLAKKPVFSDGNKTVTVTLNQGYKWSNGQPVVAKDVLFDIALIKAAVHENASNWSSYTPGYFPDSLASVTTSGKYTVVMHLKRAFNPGFFLNNQLALNLYALPSTAWNVTSAHGPHLDWTVPANAKKIYDYLGKAGGKVGTFGTNPLWRIVDGPFVLSSFSPVNASFTMKANPSYGGSPKPYVNSIQSVTYTGITPMLNAMRTGTLDIGTVDFSQLTDVSSLKTAGYNVFGLPDFGWAGDIWNFEDKTGHFNKIVAQLYFRQAMAHLVNERAIIAGIYHGAAGIRLRPGAIGAEDTLRAGRLDPSAVSVRPGQGGCTAEVSRMARRAQRHHHLREPRHRSQPVRRRHPQGHPALLLLVHAELRVRAVHPAHGRGDHLGGQTGRRDRCRASPGDVQLRRLELQRRRSIGGEVHEHLGGRELQRLHRQPVSDAELDLQHRGSFNSGGYRDPKMNALIRASVYGSDPNAVTKEASYEAKALPALFLPNYDYIWAVSKRVGGAPASYLSLTQYAFWPQFWWVNKKK